MTAKEYAEQQAERLREFSAKFKHDEQQDQNVWYTRYAHHKPDEKKKPKPGRKD